MKIIQRFFTARNNIFTADAWPRFVLLLCAFLFLASCATQNFGAARARIVPPDFFGIAPYRNPLADEDFALIDELGVVWQRRTCRWSALETEEGNWNFSDWDNYVESSKNAGKKILAILAYETSWVFGDEKIIDGITARELPAYLNYVKTVVTRYKGKIDAYEIWNEPNTMRWDASDEEFITMTRAAIKTIRSVDPDVKILAGAFMRVPKGFIRKMMRAGVFDEADGLSFHPYALGPSGAMNLCDSLTELLEEEGFSGEVWITEMGFPTSGWYPTRVSEEEFSSHIVKTLAGFAARDIDVILWYELFDENNPGEYTSTFNSESFFGLAYPNRTVKAGFNAFALCGRNIAGREYRPELPERIDIPARTASLFFAGTGNESVLLLWNEGGASYTANVILPGSGRRLYDISSGEYRELGAETEIDVTRAPLFFTWINEPDNSFPRVVRTR